MLRIAIVASLLVLPITGFAEEAASLEQALEVRAKNSASQIPTVDRTIMQASQHALENSGIGDRVIAVGAQLPDTKLLSVNGNEVNLRSLLNGQKSVVSFYRGGWCPYCNLQLHYLQKALPEIEKRGGQLIAISPEMPNNTLTTSEKNAIQFPVLSDSGNHFARQLGLVFQLDSKLIEVYKGFGIDLVKAHGDDKWELPLPATFVVDAKGKILYRFARADYKKRAPIAEILKALE